MLRLNEEAERVMANFYFEKWEPNVNWHEEAGRIQHNELENTQTKVKLQTDTH